MLYTCPLHTSRRSWLLYLYTKLAVLQRFLYILLNNGEPYPKCEIMYECNFWGDAQEDIKEADVFRYELM